jgi:hypothetical protein
MSLIHALVASFRDANLLCEVVQDQTEEQGGAHVIHRLKMAPPITL